MGIPNPYRAEVIARCIQHSRKDEHFHVRVTSGGKCLPINLDEDALRLLYAYYSGEISHREIQSLYKAAE